MFSKNICSIFLVGTLMFSFSFGLEDASIQLLSSLQTEHYSYVKSSLDATYVLSDQLYFVDDDLKANAEVYFNNLAYEELEQLAPLKEACGQDDPCLACFDSEVELTQISLNITSTLVKYFDDQKKEFNKTIADIQMNLQDSALLSTVVYETYKDSSNFEASAQNYYDRIRKALVYEKELFNKTVNATIGKLITYSIDATVKATTSLQSIFNTIVECAEAAINP